ncbi:MAG: hypothetical protein ABIN79_15585 [Marmoricola sp.]
MSPEENGALQDALAGWIREARWFGGKGRDFTVTDFRVIALRQGEPRVSIVLATLTFGDGGSDLYQLPVSSYAEPQERLAHAGIGLVDDRHVYDALHDREATQAWLEDFDSSTSENELVFHRCGTHELDLDAHSTLFSGEQSNSSVAFGDDSLMKVFRRVTPGINPDIEIHDALTREGSHSIAELYGWLELGNEAGGPPLQLAMLQQFLRTASDGWELALASARNLFSEADLHADEVGGDFASESHRLGRTVREVHLLMHAHFGSTALDVPATIVTMKQRVAAAAASVPELAGYQDALGAVFDRAAGAAGESQRVHGDLHLGQTLRTSRGWKLVDFEGEPAKTLAERQLPDSPWRDVAGMLRSFDYAAQSVAKDLDVSGPQAMQLGYRAAEWVERNRSAFIEGYLEDPETGESRAPTDAELALINAYEADKAVYEALYEARNRPTWLDIPLAALDRIGNHHD